MTRKKKEPTTAELVEMLAQRLRVDLKPGGAGNGRTFNVELSEQLRVEFSMSVHRVVQRDDAKALEAQAAERIADPERGEWTDQCDCVVRARGSWSLTPSKTTGCKKPVTGVVITRAETWNNLLKRGEPTHQFSFRCHVHLHKADDSEPNVVHRVDLHHAFKVARGTRIEVIKERSRFAALSEEEWIIEDMREAGRNDEADALQKAIPGHSYRCDRMIGAPGKFPKGNPNVRCTCDHPQRLIEFRMARVMAETIPENVATDQPLKMVPAGLPDWDLTETEARPHPDAEDW